jgi:hypothetical protein
MSNMNFIDLTDDTVEQDAPLPPPPPAIALTMTHTVNNQMWPQLTGLTGLAGHDQEQAHGAIPSPAALISSHPPLPSRPRVPYTIDNSTNFSASCPTAVPVYRGPWINIRFSLINTKEFTAKASTTVTKEVLGNITV